MLIKIFKTNCCKFHNYQFANALICQSMKTIGESTLSH